MAERPPAFSTFLSKAGISQDSSNHKFQYVLGSNITAVDSHGPVKVPVTSMGPQPTILVQEQGYSAISRVAGRTSRL